jgi:hypothetical protein
MSYLVQNTRVVSEMTGMVTCDRLSIHLAWSTNGSLEKIEAPCCFSQGNDDQWTPQTTSEPGISEGSEELSVDVASSSSRFGMDDERGSRPVSDHIWTSRASRLHCACIGVKVASESREQKQRTTS